MADDLRMALAELLRKSELEDADFLREGVRVLAQAAMELEVSQHVGAERYERSPDRRGERNGYRDRPWDTRAGTVELRVPRVRDGSFFPSLLEPRRRSERALVAVVAEAYVQGVSTRKVEALAQSLGIGGMSKSEVCAARVDRHPAQFSDIVRHAGAPIRRPAARAAATVAAALELGPPAPSARGSARAGVAQPAGRAAAAA